MRRNRTLPLGICCSLILLAACSSQVDPAENIQVFLDKMQKLSYDFQGEVYIPTEGGEPEQLLGLEGIYVAERGYRLHARVHLPQFEAEGAILSTGDQLYYRQSTGHSWRPTTDQDLQMLGFSYKESPADMFQNMKDMVLSVEPTAQANVFRVTLDRTRYAQQANEEGFMGLPRVNTGHGFHVTHLDNPVAEVEVDLNRKVIRSFKLDYEVAYEWGEREDTRHITYEMEIDNFEGKQKLPEPHQG